jgi:hypothetical protein
MIENDAVLKERFDVALKKELEEREAPQQRKYVHRKRQYEGDLRRTLGEQVKAVMQKQGWTYRNLSIQAGIASSLVYRAVNTEAGSVGILLHMLDVLGYEVKFEIRKKEKE